jgi:hypothetical protein
MTNQADVRQALIDRLRGMRKFCNESIYAKDLADEAADVLESLASQPAPSGWQQRIAAMEPWTLARCVFCGCKRWNIPKPASDQYDPKAPPVNFDNITEIERPHAPYCLWQNAVDALPPAPDGHSAVDTTKLMAAVDALIRRRIDVGVGLTFTADEFRTVVLGLVGDHAEPDAKEAIPPGPEPVRYFQCPVCGLEGHQPGDAECDGPHGGFVDPDCKGPCCVTSADASPAKEEQ